MDEHTQRRRARALAATVYPVGHAMNPAVVCVPSGKIQVPVRAAQDSPRFIEKER